MVDTKKTSIHFVKSPKKDRPKKDYVQANKNMFVNGQENRTLCEICSELSAKTLTEWLTFVRS